MKTILVVGAGSIGLRHMRNLSALGCKVLGVDINPDAYEKIQTTQAHSVYEHELLGGYYQIDGVVIATPAETHLDMIRTYRAWPLLVEKPIGLDSQLDDLAEFIDDRIMVGYMLRFHAIAQQVYKQGRFLLYCNRSHWPSTGARHGDLLIECSHEIDIALRVGACHSSLDLPRSWVSHTSAWIQLGPFTVFLSDSPQNIPEFRDWETQDSCGDSQIWPRMTALEIDTLYVKEAQHFLQFIDGGQIEPACTVAQALNVLRVIRQLRSH